MSRVLYPNVSLNVNGATFKSFKMTSREDDAIHTRALASLQLVIGTAFALSTATMSKFLLPQLVFGWLSSVFYIAACKSCLRYKRMTSGNACC